MTAQQIAMVKAKDAHAKKVLIDRSNATKTSAKIESLVASGLTSLAGEGLFIRVRRWLGM
ncbi:hypothetical protein [Polaromonas sp.]|uniref:hypothetical protein n=1 Tax=Polaromonas sp. TaxID=1869339 RepID=UPI002D799449|nr:hypothetical protein [Polaromonas sp.]